MALKQFEIIIKNKNANTYIIKWDENFSKYKLSNYYNENQLLCSIA